MKRKFWQISLLLIGIFLLGTSVVGANIAQPATEIEPGLTTIDSEANQESTIVATPVDFTTIITINSTVDTDGETQTRSCYYSDNIYSDYTNTDGVCNLRRALVEASHRPPADRPILIRFDLPLNDPNYHSDTQTWEIVMDDAYWEEGLDFNNISEPDGWVTIDGDTQPGGRTDAPKIVIHSDFSLTVLSENNTIRNLIFLGEGGLILNEVQNIGGNNTVENSWFGLNIEGTNMVPGSNPNVTLAGSGSGIFIKSDGNTISGTKVTGTQTGITVQGDNNLIHANQIGLRADGTVPVNDLDCDTPSNLYNPNKWYGGWGIKFLSGSNNQVLSNTIAALQSAHSPTETTPPAITASGSNNYFAYNKIGYDAHGTKVGTCGQAFDISGHNMVFRYNTIYGSRTSYFDGDTEDPTEGAFFYNDNSPLARKVTIRDNIVEDSTSLVIVMGPRVPESLRLFDPPRIRSIEGLQVVGETVSGSNCPGCLMELYLDDLTEGQDALQLLATATADAAGRFTATMGSALPANHAIRVTATTQQDDVIGDFWAGTTTEMSPAYGPDGAYTRQLGPGWNLFSFDVTPASNAIGDVLSDLAGKYDLVLGFDSTPGQGAKTYDPNNPGASDLLTMDAEHGYWIRITAANTQTFVLDAEPAFNGTDITLNEGWNLVSYLPDHTMAISEALSSIAGAYEMVQGYEEVGKTYVPGEPTFSDLTEMKPGYGYWIKIKEGQGQQTLNYQPYVVKRSATTNHAVETEEVSATDFFTPTTEWADFYGVALFGGQSVPRNATIKAVDADGTVAGAFSVHTLAYYGFLHVYADDPNTTVDEGIASTGEAVTFYIDGRRAKKLNSSGQMIDDPITWDGRGDLTEVNLGAEIPYKPTTTWADFWGSLSINGQPAPVGTLLAAYDADGVYSGDVWLTEAGKYGFLHVYGDDPNTTSVDEGAELGDPLTFKAWLPGSQTPVVISATAPSAAAVTWQGKGSQVESNLTDDASGGETTQYRIYLPLVLR